MPATMRGMKAKDVIDWIGVVKARGLATTDAEAGELVGKSPDTIVRMKQGGGDYTMSLACSAVLGGLGPYKAVPSKLMGLPKVRAAKVASKANGRKVPMLNTTKPVAKKATRAAATGGKPVPVKKKAAKAKKPVAKRAAKKAPRT